MRAERVINLYDGFTRLIHSCELLQRGRGRVGILIEEEPHAATKGVSTPHSTALRLDLLTGRQTRTCFYGV